MCHIRKMRGKSHMPILIDAEEAFDKIQHSFVAKSFQQASLRTFSNHRGLQTSRGRGGAGAIHVVTLV
jgi:hypothetical protein